VRRCCLRGLRDHDGFAPRPSSPLGRDMSGPWVLGGVPGWMRRSGRWSMVDDRADGAAVDGRCEILWLTPNAPRSAYIDFG